MHTLESTRFGTIEIASEAVIEFPDGLIGLGGRNYTLVAREESSPFVWLHSLDEPGLALPVTNPFHWFTTYEVELSDAEADRIGVHSPEDADVYVTVRAASEIQDFCANLLAPILISDGRGFQVINEAPGHAPCAPLFTEVVARAEQAA
jgi:flagellar assembly factor FliW